MIGLKLHNLRARSVGHLAGGRLDRHTAGLVA
jgi:hypothetical protein